MAIKAITNRMYKTTRVACEHLLGSPDEAFAFRRPRVVLLKGLDGDPRAVELELELDLPPKDFLDDAAVEGMALGDSLYDVQKKMRDGLRLSGRYIFYTRFRDFLSSTRA
ncbi:MAG: hypothetical protein ABEI52_01755 [Halobacteriaceae archaeon]